MPLWFCAVLLPSRNIIESSKSQGRVKKTIIIFTFLMTTTFLSVGQKKTYLGVKAGYNYSTATFTHLLIPLNIAEGYTPGFHVGLKGISYLKKGIGLQFELNYSRKGWKQIFDNGTEDFVSKMDYVELPILINLYLGNKKTRFYANLGTYIEYLVNVSDGPTPTDTGDFNFYPYDENRDNRFGYGYRFGGGIYQDFSFGTLFVEGSFAFGLSDILNPITDATGVPNQSSYLVGSISVGYLVQLGKKSE